MSNSDGLIAGYEFQTELFGADSQLPNYPLAVAFLEVILALVGVFLALGQQRIESSL